MLDASINGKTGVLGIIGSPVSHSFSPVIHNTISKLVGNNLTYVPFDVKPQNIADAVKGAYALGVAGFNVTVPHKQAVMPHLHEVDDAALHIGAVNTLKYTANGYIGYNTDFIGLKAALDGANIPLGGQNVIIVGAGGGAYAAAMLAAAEGALNVSILNRTVENALALKAQIEANYSVSVSVLNAADARCINANVAIQTTSVGMNSDVSPVDESFFDGISHAVDIIYTPWETKFLKDAKKSCCNVLNGFDMLFYQAVAAYEIWTDLKIAKEQLSELKKLLEQAFRNGN